MSDNRRLVSGFIIAGGIGFVVDAGVLQLLFMLGYDLVLSRVASVLMAMTVTWFLSRRFVFRTSGNRAPEYLRHLAAQSVGMAINFGLYTFLLFTYPPLQQIPVVAVVAGSAVAMVFNFLSARYWTYRDRHSGD